MYNEHGFRNRTAASAGVAAVLAVLAYGIVNGLTIKDFFVPPPNVQSTFIPVPLPPPPPDPQPSKAPEAAILPTAPMPPIPLPPQPGPSVAPLDPEIAILPQVPTRPDPGPTVQPLPPQPTPSFTPRAAVPQNDRAGWITNDDYPARALRDGTEGMVGYRLVIGSNGRVSACEITSSSGSRVLDDETCRQITRRARFDAATDQNGVKVVGTFTGTVRWQIPD